MNKLVCVSAVALAATLGGCATVTRGTTTAFVAESTPPGASVRTSTGFTCPSTPCALKMPRKEEFEITFRKAGYKPVTARVLSQVGSGGAAGMAGNILLGGIIGVGVDATSGAMNNLVPNPLRVTLEAEAPESFAGGGMRTSASTIINEETK
jgi:hypothetical protein